MINVISKNDVIVQEIRAALWDYHHRLDIAGNQQRSNQHPLIQAVERALVTPYRKGATLKRGSFARQRKETL